MNMFLIDEALLQDVFKNLISQPYANVSKLVDRLRELKKQEAEKPQQEAKKE